MVDEFVSGNIVESIEPSRIEGLLQKTRIIYIVVKFFTKDKNGSDTVRLEGECLDGSFNLTANSPIRRTCSLKFKATPGNLPDRNSPFWINKKFSIDVEIKNMLKSNSSFVFPIGVYILEDPSVNLTFTDNTISIKGVDRMALYNGEISGALLPDYLSRAIIEPTKTDKSTPFNEKLFVHQAIKKTMKLAMENIEHIKDNFPISIIMPQIPDSDNPSNTTKDDISKYQIIPYKIDRKVGDTYYSIVKELVEMDYSAQVYFDVNGNFVFSRVPNENINLTDRVYAWDFEKYNVAQSIDREIKYSNVKNNFVIYGGITGQKKEDKELLGIQVSHNVRLTKQGGSPYAPEVLGEDFTRDLIIRENSYVGSPTVYDLAKEMKKIDSDIDALTLNDFDVKNLNEIYTTPDKREKLLKTLKYAKQLCKNRANQEIYLHQNASEVIKITCLPLYHLDVNELIFVRSDESGILGSFVIKEISCGLASNSLMTITAHKIFNNQD